MRDKGELVRCVLSPSNEIVVDYNSKLPGRGGYICPDIKCIERAVRLRAFPRAFKGEVKVGAAGEIAETLSIKIVEKVSSLIVFAIKGKKAALGTVAVEGNLKKGKLCLILISSELSESAADKWLRGAQRKGMPARVVAKLSDLSGMVGDRKILGIKDPRIGAEIAGELDKLDRLGLSKGLETLP